MQNIWKRCPEQTNFYCQQRLYIFFPHRQVWTSLSRFMLKKTFPHRLSKMQRWKLILSSRRKNCLGFFKRNLTFGLIQRATNSNLIEITMFFTPKYALFLLLHSNLLFLFKLTLVNMQSFWKYPGNSEILYSRLFPVIVSLYSSFYNHRDSSGDDKEDIWVQSPKRNWSRWLKETDPEY